MRKKKMAIALFMANTMVMSLAIVFVLTLSYSAYAVINSGSSSDVHYETSECSHYCTTWGVGWHYQTLEEYVGWSGSNTDLEKQIQSGKEELAERCRAQGITGIYRLSYERFDGGRYVANQFAGQMQAGRVENGTAVYLPDAVGVEDWTSVKDKFTAAALAGVTDTDWDETSAFCYDGSLEECPPDDPACSPPPPVTSTAGFTSQSIVKLPTIATNGKVTEVISDDGQRKTIYFSIDNDSIDVDFVHQLRYNHGSITMDPEDKLVSSAATETEGSHGTELDGIYTDWRVGTTYNDQDTLEDVDPATSSADWITVSTGKGEFRGLNPGDDQEKCSKISYNNKSVTLTGTTHITNSGSSGWYKNDGSPASGPSDGTWMTGVGAESHKDYVPSYSGDGYSEVCVKVHRVKDPSGEPVSPSGNVSSKVMFAGESQNIAWNIISASHSSRKLVDGRAVVYQVPVSVPEASKPVTGNTRDSSDPCGHYGYGCVNLRTGITGDFGDSIAIKIPNEVGNKYCHSFGYKYVYQYAIQINDGAFGWIQDEREYWYNYNAVCRTIAKKPTAAIWNGGIFTNGGISASIADRFDSINFGETVNDGITVRTIFGSWSEFLTVAGKSIRNNPSATEFASGSILYNGTGKSTSEFYPLTIAGINTSNPGHSGINLNSTLSTRLDFYLKNRADSTLTSSVIGGAGWTNVNGTVIYSHNGDVTINNNITTNPGPYSSIYSIPQVILFVNGDVNITNSVTEIDAWIIATGTVNTCSEFSNTETAADPSGRKNSDICTNQLIFNGPVMANSLKLNRSFGSDPNTTTGYSVSSGDSTTNGSSRQAPAEIFNLRADTYLWAYAQSSRYDSSFTESYSRELAPRY